MYCLLHFLGQMFRLLSKSKLKYVTVCIGLFALLNYFGAFTHMFEVTYNKDFSYPYEGDIHEFVNALQHNEKPAVVPINVYNYSFIHINKQKCIDPAYNNFRVVYIVKSAVEHFERRIAIRNSWGFEKRFFDVPSKTIFLLGIHPNNDEAQAKIKIEAAKYKDIIQADFVDSYYNNTIKTMIGFNWLVKYCSNAKFYMFVDDDMYVSIKNVLRFIRNPANYPDYLKEVKKFAAQKREVKLADLLSYKLETPDLALKKNKSTYGTNIKNYDLKEVNEQRNGQQYVDGTNLNEEKFENISQTNKIDNLRPITTTRTNPNYKCSISPNKYHECMENNRNLPFNTLQHNLINNNVTVIVGNRSKRQVFDFELPEDVKLFAGFVFISSPHRHRSSKWYVSLKEYPYHLWPPYVTAGAYILSKDALIDMYYTSFYTKHFQFDDIFLGLVAKKANIEPFHCEEFHFYKKDYTKFNYKYVITSHGYSDPNELLRVWNEQKALGNA